MRKNLLVISFYTEKPVFNPLKFIESKNKAVRGKHFHNIAHTAISTLHLERIGYENKSAPSSDGERALFYFGNQAVMTFWVLDPWFCVPGFHLVCFSSLRTVSRLDKIILVSSNFRSTNQDRSACSHLKAVRISWPFGFRPFNFTSPIFTGFAFQRQPGYLGQSLDFRSLGFASPAFTGFALV